MSSSVNLLAVERLQEHIVKVAQAFLHTPTADLASKTTQQLVQFINNPLPASLLVGLDSDLHLNLSTDIQGLVSHQLVVIIIKAKGVLRDDVPVECQLQVVEFPDSKTRSGSFESLKLLVNFALTPYFDAITESSAASANLQRESASYGVTKRKIRDLAISLDQLDQFIKVPDLSMTVHPKITELLDLENHKENVNEEELLDDSVFLNDLQSIVNDWIKSVQSVSKINHEPLDGSVADEINFWSEKESALLSIQSQLTSPAVLTTLDVLKRAKRFHATVSFLSDTGVRDALGLAAKYNQFLVDLPIQPFAVSSTLEALQDSVEKVFGYMKKLRITDYPVETAIKLVETFTKDISIRLREILSQDGILKMDFAVFKDYSRKLLKLFLTIEDCIKEFSQLCRELIRKRSERFVSLKVNSHVVEVQQTAQSVIDFRVEHHKSLGLMRKASLELGGEMNLEKETRAIYVDIEGLDPFGRPAEWRDAVSEYSSKMETMERQLVLGIKSLLSRARSSEEMFAVFQKCELLLEKLSIRHALQEYQFQLLSILKQEVDLLRRTSIDQKESQLLLFQREVPETVKQILFANQVENSCDELRKKLSLVLGPQWESFPDAQKIMTELGILRERFNSESLFQKWVSQRMPVISDTSLTDGPILQINQTGDGLDFEVSFDSRYMFLIDEIRFLRALGLVIPTRIANLAADTKLIYPYYVDLVESLQVLKGVLSETEKVGDLQLLLTPFFKTVFDSIRVLYAGKWNHVGKAIELQAHFETSSLEELQTLKALEEFPVQVRDLSLKSERLHKFAGRISDINLRLLDFKDFKDFTKKGLADAFSDLQKEVNELYFEGFSEMDEYVTMANNRLRDGLVTICRNQLLTLADLDEESSLRVLGSHVHVVSIIDQKITVSPPFEYTQSCWVGLVQNMLHLVLHQPPLCSPAHLSDETQTFLIDELTLLPAITDVLLQLERVFMSHSERLDDYWNSWYHLQLLWELPAASILDRLGSDVATWVDALKELKHLKRVLETPQNCVAFGIFRIDIAEAKLKAEKTYGEVIALLSQSFADILSDKISKIHLSFSEMRRDLENSSIDVSSLASINVIIAQLQKFDAEEIATRKMIQNLVSGESVLRSHAFAFAPQWISCETIEADFELLSNLVISKRQILDQNADSVLNRIKIEHDRLVKDMNTTEKIWLEKKPVSSDINAVEALAFLTRFETELNNLSRRIVDVRAASEFMDVPCSLSTSLDDIMSDLVDLKSVWTSLDALVSTIDDCGNLTLHNLDRDLLKTRFEEAMELANSMPVRVRRHPAFMAVKNSIDSYQKSLSFVMMLVSDSFKERHWKILYQKLHVKYVGDRTLRDIWNLNLGMNRQAIQMVIDQSRGEANVEKALADVQERWTNIGLDFFEFDTGVRLVKGWDSLLELCSNDLSLLESMRTSQFYDLFEQDANMWEGQLNSIFQILNLWLDVQRSWIQLNGAFSKNTEIKSLLPVGALRYQNLTSELFALLQPVYTSGLLFDVLSIHNIVQKLDATLSSLKSIHQLLNEYLERQRELWPRFYFLNNEDLLDIVGNAKSLAVIGNHMSKMFQGVASFIVEGSNILGVSSPEGENVTFHTAISYEQLTLIELLGEVEKNLKSSLSLYVGDAIKGLSLMSKEGFNLELFKKWLDKFPCQALVLSIQVFFTEYLETDVPSVLLYATNMLEVATREVRDTPSFVSRRKLENIMIEVIHFKDVASRLEQNTGLPVLELVHLSYYDPNVSDVLGRLTVKIGTVSLKYSFEYWGLPLRLVYTPLMEKAFLAMSEALGEGKGGSLVGPAGSGKTESIKAMGQNIGRMVLVFCCDDTFDYVAIGRILTGVCKVGVWGCFDEFNRLEVKTLSAVATQIEKIEDAIGDTGDKTIDLGCGPLCVRKESGVFITSNPDYAGRSELPENLKVQYRTMTVAKPDTEVIADVLLSCQGFLHSKVLAQKLHAVFRSLSKKCSKQAHYDFGLRALKSVVLNLRHDSSNDDHKEVVAVLESLSNGVLPKLISKDVPVFAEAIKVFDIPYDFMALNAELISQLREFVQLKNFDVSENWFSKASQLYEIQKRHKGVILFGEYGVGKSTMLSSVMHASEKLTGARHKSYTIDPKVVSKSSLYGSFDPATRVWKDGIFTSILRESLKDDRTEVTWVIFDGDVDPEWVENLNSVLDDNGLLTLANGERLKVPPSLKIFLEVDTLKSATPATISRCGIVWLGELFPTSSFIFKKVLSDLDHWSLESYSTGVLSQETLSRILEDYNQTVRKTLSVQKLGDLLSLAETFPHIMDFGAVISARRTLTMLKAYRTKLVSYVLSKPSAAGADFTEFAEKAAVLAAVWAFTGDLPLISKQELERRIISVMACEKMTLSGLISQYDLDTRSGNWIAWKDQVSEMDLAVHQVMDPNVIISTPETVKYTAFIDDVIKQHRPLLLCGPPGSGKTMLVLSALSHSPHHDFVGLNFSKDTTPHLLITTLEHHCTYKSTAHGLILSPAQPDRWIVLFCDEINLPSLDAHGSQPTISLLRQIIEQGGFWRESDHNWVQLKNVQFIGACNPPTDRGRNKLSPRFLRHLDVVLLDYPERDSLSHIYRTFMRTTLKLQPAMISLASDLTEGMIQFYEQSKKRFTPDIHSHYVFSPRELTRWVKGLHEALESSTQDLTLDGIVRLWSHEALRLFQDRLVDENEKNWSYDTLKSIVELLFDSIDVERALQLPIIYSEWLSFVYSEVTYPQLRTFLQAKLRVFCEEELSVSLVLYNDLIDHILRIHRVLKQPQGHLMLVGPTGSGKTTISKFVAWLNGIDVIHLTPSRNYSLDDFDTMLRDLIRKSGVEGRKTCLLIDDSAILSPVFLERLNTLLANAEIPGLFEGEEKSTLVSSCREKARSSGHVCDNEDEALNWLRRRVSTNVHVVLTTSDPDEKESTQYMSSPALFNRFVVNWMGDWSVATLREVSQECLASIPIYGEDRDLVVTSCVKLHQISQMAQGYQYCTPIRFLRFINAFKKVFTDKSQSLNEQNHRVNRGLDKLKETLIKIKNLKDGLSAKKAELDSKDMEASMMLERILAEQSEAEKKQEASIELRVALKEREESISEQQAIVEAELSVAEPAVVDAQRGVRNIKKQHLTELRAMNNPPEAVKITLESVCTLLGYDVGTWRDVQLVIRKDDFIASIVNFDSETQLSRETLTYMEEVYLSRADFNFEAVNRASKACGPMLEWVIAQIRYASVLEKIGPLREEVEILENEASHARAQVIAADEMISELKESIAHYKEAYGNIVGEAERIKAQVAEVEEKVERSYGLLESLSSERTRWAASVTNFHKDQLNLLGDSLLLAASLVYFGDQYEGQRRSLYESWREMIAQLKVMYNNGVSLSESLVTPAEILRWKNMGLADEKPFIENVITLKCIDSAFNYIVDPTGSMVTFLNEYVKPKKLITTSFLNNSFIRHLENAMRFGSALLITDGEYYDPVINRIVAREFFSRGARMLARLGDREVDVSPDFQLFIHTRDSSYRVPAFVASRTNFVNFSFSFDSMEARALNLILSAERPEVASQREESKRVQGEYKIKLESLEDKLLQSLAESDEHILENRELLNLLQSLKTEASDLGKKIEETSNVERNLALVSEEYRSLASIYALAFELLSKLQTISSFYQIPLTFYDRIFTDALSLDDHNPAERVMLLVESFGSLLYKKLGASVFYEDHLLVAILLVYAYIKILDSAQLVDGYKGIIETFAKTKDLALDKVESWLDRGSIEQDFTKLLLAVQKRDSDPELLQISLHSIEHFNLGQPQPYTLENVLEEDLPSTVPIIICSPDKYDAKIKLHQLAKTAGKALLSVSMGSAEGEAEATRDILSGARSGGWVLVQNIHMAPGWVSLLEQTLSSLQASSGYRLFLTCNSSSELPLSLLKASRVVAVKTDPGIKALFQESLFSTLSLRESDSEAKRRVYFLLAWFHCVVLERLRYAPVGWSKPYDFGESDLLSAKYIVDSYLDSKSVPWPLIGHLIGNIVYGGKLNTQADMDLMTELTEHVFTDQNSADDYSLVKNLAGVSPPAFMDQASIQRWAAELPESTPIAWLDIPESAELEAQREKNRTVCLKALEILDN